MKYPNTEPRLMDKETLEKEGKRIIALDKGRFRFDEIWTVDGNLNCELHLVKQGTVQEVAG